MKRSPILFLTVHELEQIQYNIFLEKHVPYTLALSIMTMTVPV